MGNDLAWAALEEALAIMMPAAAVWAHGAQGDISALLPPELALLEAFGPARHQEFILSRTLAHQALGRLGYSTWPLLRGPSGEPLWPANVVGAVTHCKGYGLVAASLENKILSLGLDLERVDRLKPELIPRILRPAELAWLLRQPAESHMMWATLFFSAKEAFYKCQYPLTSRFLGFQDVEIAIDALAGHWRMVTYPSPLAVLWKGRYAFVEDYVCSCAVASRS